MDKELQNELFSRLDALTLKLGVGAEHIWEVVINQSIIEGWTGLVTKLLVMFVIFGFGFYSFYFKRGINWYNTKGNPTLKLWVAMYTVLFAFMSLISGGLDITDSITKITNPEYHAFQDITSIAE